jgi:hypothetical protein
MDEDVEATRVADWDKASADAAYRAQVEQAHARQRLLKEEREREVCLFPCTHASQSKPSCISMKMARRVTSLPCASIDACICVLGGFLLPYPL